MTAAPLLARLRELGVKVWAEGDRLRYRGPQDALTPELLAEMARLKPEILAFLRQARGGGAAAAVIRPASRDAGLPLSFAQQRLWFLHQLRPDSPAYNEAAWIGFAGPLAVPALGASLGEIVRRHEVLRTTFESAAGLPRQVIHPRLPLSMPIALPIIDLAGLPAALGAEEARRLSAEEARRPFDLARGPLLRATLLRLGAGDHALLLTLHHLVNDGWSMREVFAPEMAASYEAFSRGVPPPLPALPVQYADFAVWQRGWLADERLEAELSYWRERLADPPAVLELPADRPRPAAQSFQGGRVPLHLPRGLQAALEELGRREGVTLFATLLAAFAALLGRYSGQEDLLIGSPVSGRGAPQLDSLIGFFINTQVLRIDLSGDPAFRGLLGRVWEAVAGAQRHQEIPFEKLVEELQPERSLSFNPFFQTIFAFQSDPKEALRLPGLEVEFRELDNGSAKFDLNLSLETGERGLGGFLEFSSDLFDRPTAARLLEHFRVLLEGAAAHPGARLSELPLLTEPERHQLLTDWNDTALAAGEPVPVHRLVEAWASRAPDALAVAGVAGGGGELTYLELNRRANRLARRLRRLGVGPEAPVGILLDRSPDLVVALLAVLKAGGAYLPLDPAHPPSWLGLMMEDSGTRVVVTRSDRPGLLEPAAGALRICLDLEAEMSAEALDDDGDLAESALAGHPAYVIYTSGSTGRPKGVAVSHGGLFHLVAWHLDAFRLTAADRCTQLAGIGFDASVWEVWPVLAAGASLHLPDEPTRLSPDALAGWLRGQEVSVTFLPTPLAEAVLALPEPAGPALRILLTGGDRLHQHPAAALPFTLVNNYGPTESTVVATSGPVPPVPPVPAGSRAPGIGRPIANSRIYVLDPAMRPVPAGVPGECAIGGASLARGYLGRPDWTAERFVPDPFAGLRGEPGARLYRTGDRVRRLADGTLDFLGRVDQQVKVRGFRIEPGDVEAKLLEHPGVRDAAVVLRDAGEAGASLVAYFSPARAHAPQAPPAPAAPEAAELRLFLGERLPSYMVPAAFVQLETLPLTANGKVDRRALPAPGLDGGPEGEPAAPRTPVEAVLAGIAAELLGRERVGMQSSFFALGGHSLLVMQLLARIRHAFNAELSVAAIFEAPTLADLALRIEEGRGPDHTPWAPPLESAAGTGEIPLSFAQRQLWFLDQLAPGDPAYNVPAALRLTGGLSPAGLAAGLRELVRRHAVLRTTFGAADGRPFQVVAPEAPPGLPLVDLGALPAAVREGVARELAAAEALRPFDLVRGPLVRAALLRLAPAEHVLLLTLHHIVADGASIEVFFRELGALYGAALRGHPSPLPEPAVQYADYAVWQRRWLTDEAMAGHLAFWREALAGAPERIELPADRPRPAVAGTRGGARRGVLPARLGAALDGLGHGEGATLFMTLLAGLGALLSRFSGQTDLLIGSPTANRARTEIEGLIGFFANTQVFRLDLSGGPGFRELLARVRHTALAAYAHQDLPFERLVEELQPKRDLSGTPVFQVMLVLQTAARRAPELPGVSLAPLGLEAGTAKFDLTWTVEETGEGLGVELKYRADLFDPATVVRLLAHFERLLEGAAAEPDRPVADLGLLLPAEAHQVALEWNDTRAERPAFTPVHRLFSARAAQMPGEAAVVDARGGLSFCGLSFGELETASNRLARHLPRLGVGRESVVAVCLERSPAMVVGILGILKAGGAYLPLDPAQPPQRLASILAESGAAVLLTEAELLPDLPVPPGLRTLCVDADASAVAAESAGDPGVEILPEQLAYVIFTSGSTGRPKGVMIRHAGLANLVDALEERIYRGRPPLRVGLNAPIVFDASVKQIVQLAQGRTLCLLPEDARRDGAEMLAWIERLRVNALDITPVQVRMALAAGLREGSALRLALVAGEALDAGLWSELADRADLEAYNVYGPTECTVDATACRIEPGRPVLGRPLRNVRLFVLDRGQRPVPPGVPGELCIGGAGLARGYLGRPDLTAERFLPDPFGGEPGERLYRSGDLVRWLADGRLEFLGRIDHQVKLRGYRIELGEIEAVLATHPAVLQAVADVRVDGSGHPRLVAYFVASPGQAADAADTAELRRFLRERLPDYMVPALFVALEALPVTRGGKVDRGALPAPGPLQGGDDAPPPRDEVEEALCRIWSEVLGVSGISGVSDGGGGVGVGIHDNFFELGGDSILSIQVVARAKEAGLDLTPKQLFQNQTIAELARSARERRPAGAVREDRPEEAGAAVPLTPVQLRFFALDTPEPHHYNQAVLLAVEPPADAAGLERGVAGWLRDHPALRLRFRREEGGWRARQGGGEQVSLPRIDLSGLPPARRAGALNEAAGLLQASLDLARGPLLRTALFQEGHGAAGRFFAAVHHLVVDGVSWRVLLEDLDREYRGGGGGGGGGRTVPAATTSWRGWAERLAALARSPGLEEERAFWLETVGGGAPLPRDLPGGNTRGTAVRVSLELDGGETEALLKPVAQACRARADELLLTAVAQALAGWAGGHRLLLSLEGHGREELPEAVDLSRTVGWFTAVYPVLLDLAGAGGPWQTLRRVKESLRSVPRGGIGYGLLRYLGGGAELAAAPQPEVVFNYLGRLDRILPEGSAFELAPEPAGAEQSPATPRRHLLEIQAGVRDGRLRMEWIYSERIHRRETVERLAEACGAALARLLEEASSRGAEAFAPVDFPLARLSQAELDQVLAQLPGGRRAEDLYPLSSLQEGMLFHHLYGPGSAAYFEQILFELRGDLDEAAFRGAWQALVDRHPALRSAFLWQGLASPLQVVAERAVLPWEPLDWSGLSEGERESRMEDLLRVDREQGFDLAAAPLMRVRCIRTAPGAFTCLWSHHHLLLDGWCLPLLLRDLFLGYQALREGLDFEPERTRPYRDYIAFLRRQDRAESEAYWRRALAGVTAPPALGIDQAPGGSRDSGAPPHRREMELSEAVMGELRTLARRHHLTLNTLVSGAWAILLSRYGGSGDVLYGATVSGRSVPLAGVGSMIGLFINTLPVRAGVDEGESLAVWLQGLQERQAEMRQFEHSSLVDIQGWSGVQRGQPLFEALLVFENYPMEPGALDELAARCGLTLAGVHGLEKSNYPLNLVCAPGRRLLLRVIHDPRRIDDLAAARLLEHLGALLAGFPAAVRLEDLALLSGAERHQLLLEWNDTAAACPAACIHELFERQADRTPDTGAVVWGDVSLTYGELDRRANRLARHLRSVGAGPGARVGLCLDRSPEMVVAMLAILKAGGAYVPLDPVHPPERLAFMAEDAGLSALVTQDRLAAVFPASPGGLPAVRVDGDAARIASRSEERFPGGVEAGGLAYVIYTSGSTGRPKGVAVPHRAVVRLVLETDYVRLAPGDRVAQASNASFDAATFEIWGALLCGACLVGIEKEIALSPAGFAAELRGRGVTTLFLTTALFNQMAGEPAAFRPLRHLLFGGEAVDPGQVRRVLRDGAPERLLHVYGPTENTTFSTWHRVGEVPAGAATVPIGRPIANTRMVVVDRRGRPVPAGITGELLLGGEGLAHGYLGRPDLTAGAFVPDPFSGEPGARLYRTGDLVRQKPEGAIEFAGRVDHQIKLRGFRIELGEIESALTRHPGVGEAAVLVREAAGEGGEAPRDRRLVAYVVPSGARPALQELREHLLGILPEYQVPSAFVFLEALPLTPNGKVDRRALPEPEAGEAGLTASFVAPRTPAEEILAGLWEQVLGIPRVGREDDFFALGGHSLLATRLISRVRQTFGVEVPIRGLFESPVLADFAREVGAAQGAARPGGGLPPLAPVPREGRMPLSFGQQRLWFLDWLVPEDPSFNVSGALRLTGSLDPRALAASFREIVRRHEALRTTFPADAAGAPFQRIGDGSSCRLSVVDLEALPAAQRSAEALLLARREALLPFDLARGPLTRLTLLRVAAREHVLLVTLHHIVADGWSVSVIVKELVALMAAIASGEPASLPELPVQYADYAAWQRQWLAGEILEERLAFWRERLAGAPSHLDLPTDRPRPPVQTTRGGSRALELPRDLTARLHGLSRDQGATLFMSLLAGFAALLQGWTGRTDLVVGTSVANRNRAEVENLAGLFVNLLPLRTSLAGEPGFLDLLARVRETALGAYSHQEVPFEKIVEALEPERDPSRPPLVQMALTLDEAWVDLLELPGLSVTPLFIDNGTAKLDLVLHFSEVHGVLEGQARYNADLFDAVTVLRLGHGLETLLRAAAGSPGTPVSGLPLLPAAERQQVLNEWTRGEGAAPAPLFPDVFESWAALGPEGLAILAGDERLTYGELNLRANQLAHRLAALGAGPESLVGVCLERSADLIVAVLAVLKAGGAYLPLDPSYPRERLAFMLEDSAVAVILTKEALADRIAGVAGAAPLLLDAEALAVGRESGANPGRRLDPANLAYVIYTSGSTGRPKGVQISHGGLANLVAEQRRRFSIGPGSRTLQFFSPSFDASVWEIVMTLGSGATLCVSRREEVLPGPDLADRLAGLRVTHVTLPPSALAVMPERALPDLAWLIAAGEACPPVLAERWGAGRHFGNGYGPTEATVCVTLAELVDRRGLDPLRMSIGKPLAGVEAWILDSGLRPVPAGVVGEILAGGAGLARGYLGRPGLTAERFIPHPFAAAPGARLYRTGDLARWLPDGSIEVLGRMDGQVKVRGFRIEPGEIEAVLLSHPKLRQAAVVLRGEGSDSRLVAYVAAREEAQAPPASELRSWLAGRLPEPMIPAAFVPLGSLPVTPNGKLDRDALPAPAASAASAAPPVEGVEAAVAGIWREVLQLDEVGAEDNFFDLGGHSLLLAQVHARLRSLGHDIPLVELFQYPTLRTLAERLEPREQAALAAPTVRRGGPVSAVYGASGAVAIVGMAGRFPGARSVAELWANLAGGVESVSFFSREELLAAGVDPALVDDPAYVPARGVLADADLFDASFFGFTPREAALTDPQQRLFLECSWEALEDAGCDPARYPGPAGVFAGVSASGYALDVHAVAGGMTAAMGNDRDFLATRVSYKLALTGPSLVVQTACSTSLVAVHLACRSLLAGECGVALAGGVSVRTPLVSGYLHEPESILSPDGHCRAFDAGASGTVGGSGLGVVVLKRLEDAVAEGDRIRAVIRGSAINNDGALKVGYTAPSVEGQAKVIADALAAAGVEPHSVGYVEAHGTGTLLGDPIEVAALRQAFGPAAGPASCALGSIKTNVGHLDAAAGVAGLIKAALALEHRQIPPSLHFERPNPGFALEGSPFQVSASLSDWAAGAAPRRAGVSSFGIGGTNAHVVLEEAPAPPPSGPARRWQVLPLSARAAPALEAATDNLARHLGEVRPEALPDLAYTLQTGRRAFEHRRVVLCEAPGDAAAALRARAPGRIWTGRRPAEPPKVVFLFPGQGVRLAGAAAGLYRDEPGFRRRIDDCCGTLEPLVGLDLRALLFPPAGGIEEAGELLGRTALTQPALFALEHSLAGLWMDWGVRPEAMIGHSVGEYVAACLAGVLSLEEALVLVAARGRLMQELPEGAMLSLALSPDEAEPLLAGDLSLAAINGPRQCVVSGPPEAVSGLEKRLAEQGVSSRRLRTSHAFHSSMMDAVLPAFLQEVQRVRLRPPAIPFLSNLTGTWICPEEATDPAYWVYHLRETVRFADGLEELARDGRRVFLEAGPGRTLAVLARRHPAVPPAQAVLSSLEPELGGTPGEASPFAALGRLWLAGVEVDWEAFHAHESRRKVQAPTYPFERRRYWVEAAPSSRRRPRGDRGDRFYLPSWRPTLAPSGAVSAAITGAGWLVFADGSELSNALLRRVRESGREAVEVLAAGAFAPLPGGGYAIDPRSPEDYGRLLRELAARGLEVDRILHLWTLTPQGSEDAEPGRILDLGFHSLLLLGQALGQSGDDRVRHLGVVSNRFLSVTGGEPLCPAKATLTGPCRVLPIELANLRCAGIDVILPAPGGAAEARLAGQLLAEVSTGASAPVVAYRGAQRWVQGFEPVRLEEAGPAGCGLRQGGVYLITGGLGGVGLEVAACLAGAVQAKLILLSRSRPSGAQAGRLQALEALGAEIETVSADVTDPEQVRTAVEQGRRRFGRIHGVIHAAGLPSGGLIPLTSPEQAARVMAPKVQGTLVLDEVFRLDGLDFFLLCSSQSSYVGLPGRIDYTAANAFLDAFAQARAAAGGPPVISVAWDTWKGIGMAAGGAPAAPAALPEGMSAAEGIDAFLRILRARPAQVIVSTEDFPGLVERVGALSAAFAAGQAPATPATPDIEPALHPRPSLAAPYVAPGTPAERTLAGIWQELLGIAPVGVEDNFFELGGDSVLSIQVVSRARKLGLFLTARQVFDHPTVGELAVMAARARQAEVPEPERETEAGPFPLLPIQRWFFEQELLRPGRWNQAALLAPREPLPVSLLSAAAGLVIARHEALRLRFARVGAGWRQDVAAAEGGEPPLVHLDLSGLPPAARRAAVESAAVDLQGSLDFQAGPLARFAFFELGKGEPGRMLIVIHHLVVDFPSWRILLEELTAACEALRHGEEPSFPAATAPLRRWARRLAGHTRSPGIRGEISLWLEAGRARVRPLPVDHPAGANRVGSAAAVSVELSPEETRRLQEAPLRHRASIEEALLAALALAFSRWTGEPRCLVELEGDGREASFPDLDLSRTVGWLTVAYPAFFDLRKADGGPGSAFRLVKEQLRAFGRGLGHGLLRYPEEEEPAAGQLASLPRAEVVFLYLGPVAETAGGSSLFVRAPEPAGGGRDPRERRTHLLEVQARIEGGALRVDWTFSPESHERATVEALAGGFLAALREILALDPAVGEGGHTPADFPWAGLRQAGLEGLIRGFGPRIEDIYALSPLQQGLLFESVYNPGSEVYRHQLHWVLEGDLDAGAFARAWRLVAERHQILRSAFVWEGVGDPVQVVLREAAPRVDVEDWRGSSRAEQEERLGAFLAADRSRGFELSAAPLMRLALLRMDGRIHEVVWLYHHLLLDGWSVPRVIHEVFTAYEAMRQGLEPVLEPVRPYRAYIAWLQSQDLSGAERFWRRALAGFTAATPLPGALRKPEAPGEESFAEREIRLSPVETQALESLARRRQVTLNTAVQGLWALLLSYLGGVDDVVFGATVAGRPPDLEGVESMVGVFINTLPVRLKVAPAAGLLDSLVALQDQQADARLYEYSPLASVQRWSEVSPGEPLFESHLVFESFPMDVSRRQRHGGLEIRAGRSPEKTNSYPLILTVRPGEQLCLWLICDRRRFEEPAISRLTVCLEHLLQVFAGLGNVEAVDAIDAITVGDLFTRLRERLESHEEASLRSAKSRKLAQVRRKAVVHAGDDPGAT